MIKQLVNKILQYMGLKLIKVPKQKPPLFAADEKHPSYRYINELKQNPLDANVHFDYAKNASKNKKSYLAFAELKTAEYLGLENESVDDLLAEFMGYLPNLSAMNHNQYYRYHSLASEIMERAGVKKKKSVLDVGGGQGMLASFIPNAFYCLAEPLVNGISGTNLPFEDASFDYVVSCHVYEHIPQHERKLFLDQMIKKARLGVFLLNPFEVKGVYSDESLELILENIGSSWAREHLECSLPQIEQIKEYALKNDLNITIKSNGSHVASTAFVFLDYFAHRSGNWPVWQEINKFFNEKYNNIMSSEEYPAAYLIYLEKKY